MALPSRRRLTSHDAVQLVAEIAADLASKMPAALTDADAASVTFQVPRRPPRPRPLHPPVRLFCSDL